MTSSAPAIPKDADRAVRNALSDVLAYAAYELEVAQGRDDTVAPEAFGPWLDPQVAAAIGPAVRVLDLHGQRAAAARARMKAVHEPLAIVFFGKGTGVLRDVFFEVFAATDDYRLAGLSGETDERPQPSMALLVRTDAHAKVLAALGKAPSKRTDAANRAAGSEGDEPAPKKPRARKAKAPVARAAPSSVGNTGALVVLAVLAAALAYVFPLALVGYAVVAVWYFEGRRRK